MYCVPGASGTHFLQEGFAHQIYGPDAAPNDQVVRRFGREILNEEGTVNHTNRLNAVVYSAIVNPRGSAQNAMVIATKTRSCKTLFLPGTLLAPEPPDHA